MTELPIDTPLGKLELRKVIEYYDFPRLFTCQNSTGQIYFALSTYDDDDELHWIYLPVSSLRLDTIFNGGISLHSAFIDPEGGFLFSIKSYINKAAEFSYLLPEQISEDDLPEIGYVLAISDEMHVRSSIIDPSHVAKASRRETFNYRIFPEEPKKHEIASRKLGEILSTTQELLDALGQSSQGQASIYGPIALDILEKTKINVSHVFEGSFGIQFIASQFSDLLEQSLISTSIAEFGNVILAADSEDILSNKLHSLKGRVASKYRKLLKELSEINSGIELNWGTVQNSGGGVFSLSRDQVRKAYAIVTKISIEMSNEITIFGQLIGFNSRSLTYEIESSDDGKKYSGKVTKNARITIQKPTIGEYYYANLQLFTETQLTSGEESTKFVLVELSQKNT